MRIILINIVVGHLAVQVFSFRVEPEDPKINDPDLRGSGKFVRHRQEAGNNG